MVLLLAGHATQLSLVALRHDQPGRHLVPYPEQRIIGLAPESGKGGGWTGESIGYVVDGRHYTLSLENHLVFCGPGLDHPSC